MAISKRLMELILMCQEPEEESYDYTQGYFDEDLSYHWNPEYAYYNDKLYVWEWTVWPEIIAYAKSLGIQVPVDPPVDLSKTF